MGERGARPRPELANLGVGVELVRIAPGGLAEVQGRRVTVGGRLHHEHAGGDGVGAPAGQMGESGVGAIGVIRVVGAHLRGTGGDDQALAGVQSRESRAAVRGEGGLFARGWHHVDAVGPVR